MPNVVHLGGQFGARMGDIQVVASGMIWTAGIRYHAVQRDHSATCSGIFAQENRARDGG